MGKGIFVNGSLMTVGESKEVKLKVKNCVSTLKNAAFANSKLRFLRYRSVSYNLSGQRRVCSQSSVICGKLG